MIIGESKVMGKGVNVKSHKKIIDIIKDVFSIKVVPYVLLLVLVASVNILGVQPLAYVMLGVAIMFKIPLVLPLIVSILTFVIFKSPTGILVHYSITYVLYVILTVSITVEGISKRKTSIIKLIVSTIVASLITLCFQGFGLQNILKHIINILLITCTYPVFTNGCIVLFNFTKHMIFSKEETIAFLIVIAMALMPFAGISIYRINIITPILITLVVIMGWQNDWLIGCSTGVILGFISAIITGQSTLYIVSFVISGLVAGLMNRLNKVYLSLGVLLSNVLLLLIFTGTILNTSLLIQYAIVTVILFLIPNKLLVNLHELLDRNFELREGYQNRLGPAGDIKNRLGAIGEVLDNLANLSVPITEETTEETKDVIKKYILDYKENECINCKNKHSCLNDEIDLVAGHIALRLEEGKIITKEMLPVECSLNEEMILNIQDIYNNMKLMRVIQARENETSQKLVEEYRSISNVIKSMSKEMDLPKKADTKEQKLIREDLKFLGYIVYEDTYNEDPINPIYEFITDILIDIDKAKENIQKVVSDALHTEMKIKLILNSSKTEKSRVRLIPSNKYIANTVVRQIKKTGSTQTGDSYIVTELKDNSKIFAISDGMGSGEKSKEISSNVINMIEKLTISGINKNEILDIINSVISFRENANTTATLDMCVLNEKKDVAEFVKIGAAKSYVIANGKVTAIEKENMPLGVTSNVKYFVEEVPIQKEMFVVLMSDGASADINEKILEKILEEASEELTETELIDSIIKEIIGVQNKIILDDMTILVCKII